ncbi:serine/threonine protein kinase [Candidatus Micrarchaeota archaeon]|nr:serine/threonine protein kinase [Candidatus Micrarchaeota archaeon]
MKLSSHASPLEKSGTRKKKFSGYECKIDDNLVGKKVNDRYQLIEKIGEGGCGNIYCGYDEEKKDFVAVKIDIDGKDLVAEEAAILSTFSNENIVRYLDHGTFHGKAFMVTELLEGESLADAMMNGISWEQLKQAISQVCTALKAVHQAEYVHRDIKPGNIFLAIKDGVQVAKLLDFGIARKVGVDEGPLKGTPTYIAPEVGSQLHYDQRADIYALGSIMYRALCGTAPFIGEFLEVLIRSLKEDPLPPSKKTPVRSIPREIDAIVLKAMAKEPENRYQNVEELMADLINCKHSPKELEQPPMEAPTRAEAAHG